MRIAVIHHTDEFRGDHAADVCRVVDILPGETVDALTVRLLTPSMEDPHTNAHFDSIEIKLVEPPESEANNGPR